MTGNNPDNRHTKGPSRNQAGRPGFGAQPAKPMVRYYLTLRPVMERPMVIRWISDVPSKVVKQSSVASRYDAARYWPVTDAMTGMPSAASGLTRT